MNLRRLKLQARALFARRRADLDLDEELAFHIDRETQRHVANGISPAGARTRAMVAFGSVTVAADECRDARGTAWFDSLVRDVLYACRSFLRAPLASLTIVGTVGLGLGLVAVVFTLLNEVIFRADAVRNPHELFEVTRQPSAGADPELFTRQQYDALVRETRVFSSAFARGPGIDRRVDGRKMQGTLVTGNFFQVLGVGAARGRTLLPSDDEDGGQPIVLSHRSWSRHFASDPGVLSRTVLMNGVPFQVVGVMPEGFRGLEIGAPDFWAPFSLLDQFRRDRAGREDRGTLHVIGRLKPGLSRGQALAQLLVWDSRRVAGSVERPSTSLSLEPSRGTVPLSAEAMLTFMPLFFAFGLILMIGCANVANLLLARGVARQREIGVRLAMGASRRRIICQLLTESLVLALAAAAIAFGISRLVLEIAVYALMSTFPPDLGDIRLFVPPADWRLALFLVAGAIASTVFFALAPALQSTRFELVRAMRGEVVRDARPSRARNVLVALQVTASVLLLICSAVFLRSALAASTLVPGVRSSDTIMVSVVDEQLRRATIDAVTSEPAVASVAASSPVALGAPRAAVAVASASNAAEAATRGKLAVGYRFVSPQFFSVLGIDIVRGRGFAETESSALVAVTVVSESAARLLWPGQDAVGQILRLEPDTGDGTQPLAEPPLPTRTFSVVGVARDVPGFKFARFNTAVAYVPTSADAAGTQLALRVHGDSEQARAALVERLAAIDPNMGEVVTLRLLARTASYFLQLAFWLTLVLGALALLLTLSGLFSVLSYLVEQRTREIGVRMALGATSRSIGALVLSQSARPVGIGLLLGGSLTAALGAALLATPAAELIGSVVRLFDPVAYAASLLCIVTACVCAALVPALRAGRIDPVAAIRQE